MTAFEVSLNGRRACVAGVPGFGVLSLVVSAVRRPPQATGRSRTKQELRLEVAGLESRDSGPGEHLKWIARNLRAGDRVSIRVVRTATVDPPAKRHRDDPAMIQRAKRRYLAHLKKELGRSR